MILLFTPSSHQTHIPPTFALFPAVAGYLQEEDISIHWGRLPIHRAIPEDAGAGAFVQFLAPSVVNLQGSGERQAFLLDRAEHVVQAVAVGGPNYFVFALSRYK